MAAAVLWWPADAVTKDTKKEPCDKTVLYLGEDVERIQWLFPGFIHLNFQGFVVYRNGRTIMHLGEERPRT
ncbi:MAG: hypothetical protein ACR2PM_12605 [Hyphomicrobiales bacterium]